LFTDGQWSGDRIGHKNDAEALRNLGVDIYCVGTPGAGADPFMVEITGKTERIYNPTDTRDLARQFLQFAQDAVAGFTRGGQITHRIDGRHFSTRSKVRIGLSNEDGTPGSANRQGYRSNRRSTHTRWFPLSAGLWKVGVEPPVLTFAEQDGKLQEITATSRPWLLKVTYFTLFVMLLPALLWALAHLDFEREERQVVAEIFAAARCRY